MMLCKSVQAGRQTGSQTSRQADNNSNSQHRGTPQRRDTPSSYILGTKCTPRTQVVDVGIRSTVYIRCRAGTHRRSIWCYATRLRSAHVCAEAQLLPLAGSSSCPLYCGTPPHPHLRLSGRPGAASEIAPRRRERATDKTRQQPTATRIGRQSAARRWPQKKKEAFWCLLGILRRASFGVTRPAQSRLGVICRRHVCT